MVPLSCTVPERTDAIRAVDASSAALSVALYARSIVGSSRLRMRPLASICEPGDAHFNALISASWRSRLICSSAFDESGRKSPYCSSDPPTPNFAS